MTLQDRLERARDEYRALDPSEVTSTEPAPRPRRWPAVAAVAALIAAVAGVATLSTGDDSQELEAGAPANTQDQSVVADPDDPDADDPDPPGAVAVHDPRIELDPPGPYSDGQSITVRVPEGMVDEFPSGGGRLCAVVADAPDGPTEWCDPLTELAYGAGGSNTEATAVLSRSVFTPTGNRDCAEPAVTCRLVVRDADQRLRASDPLRFEGTAPDPEVRLDVQPTEPQGGYEVSAIGASPHPSWLEFREQNPQSAAGFAPLYLRICAFDTSARTEGPFGEHLWPDGGAPELPLPTANCDSLGQWDELRLDPDDPERIIEVEQPRYVYGYGGWSDCTVDDCFLVLRQARVSGTTADGATLGSDVPVAAALLDSDWVGPSQGRPSIEVVTEGPHRADQQITISVAGLPDGYATNIGVCTVDRPWGCGYISALFGQIDNGEHVIRLPDPLLCPPQTCYLELDSQGEGLPPLAVVPLETG